MKKRAFTLAEVLISLVIIGIVSALTVPAVMQNTNKKELITSLKKVYSDINQAFNLAQYENGVISEWGLVKDGTADHARLAEILAPYFNLVKICPAGEAPSCYAQTEYKHLSKRKWFDGRDAHSVPTAIAANGMMLSFEVFTSCGTDVSGLFGNGNSTICGDLFVDVNGAKGPNVNGIDVFSIYLADTGAVPRGIPSMESGTSGYGKFSSQCNKQSPVSYACAGWVIYNENMDYLECSDLSWDGKHSCNEKKQ